MPLQFTDIRGDWYVTNSTIPRAVLRSLDGTAPHEFVGFPRQWLPFFEWYGLVWRDSVAPSDYIPFFSDLGEQDLVAVVARSRAHGTLRTLLESASVHDAILADCLYIVDQKRDLDAAIDQDAVEISEGLVRGDRVLQLNGWQAYGRPSVRAVERQAMAVRQQHADAIVLPCALRRPYGSSHTHHKIYEILMQQGFELDAIDKIVITSLGILPEPLWAEPSVRAYNAGVPDIYRLLRLARAFFTSKRYGRVIDCLQFEPYSDVLRILFREGLFGELQRVRIPGRRPFAIRP